VGQCSGWWATRSIPSPTHPSQQEDRMDRGRHEEGAAQAAAGQAKLTGPARGLLRHTPAAITWSRPLRAKKDMRRCWPFPAASRRRCGARTISRRTSPDLLFRDVAIYTQVVSAPDQAAHVFHQAIAAAYWGARRVAAPEHPRRRSIGQPVQAQGSSLATLRPSSRGRGPPPEDTRRRRTADRRGRIGSSFAAPAAAGGGAWPLSETC